MFKTVLSAIATVSMLTIALPGMAQVSRAQPPSIVVGQPPPENLMRPGDIRPAPDKLTEAEIRSALQGEGYSEIEIIRFAGATYDVQAMKDGQPYLLQVDGLTGQVKSSTPG